MPKAERLQNIRNTEPENHPASRDKERMTSGPEQEPEGERNPFPLELNNEWLRQQGHLSPIQTLGTLGAQPQGIREHDLATVWSRRVLDAHGTDGEGRFLIYAKSGENYEKVWETLRELIQNLDEEKEALLVRLDRVHLYSDAVDSLVETLYDHKEPNGSLTQDKRVVFVNPDKSTMRALYHALEIKNDLCMVLDARQMERPETWKLWYVGKFQANLQLTLNFIQRRMDATSHDIEYATELLKERQTDPKIEPTKTRVSDAQRRLDTLYEKGLLTRKPGVSESKKLTYDYTFFHPARTYCSPESNSEFNYSLYNAVLMDKARQLCDESEQAIINNNLPEAETLVRKGLDLSKTLRDAEGIARALDGLGDIYRNLKKPAEAIPYHLESLELRRILGEPYAIAQSLNSIGVDFAERHDADEKAEQYYRECLELRQEIGDATEAAKTMNNMANLYLHMKKFDEMDHYSRASLRVRMEQGIPRWIASSLFSMALQSEAREKWERVVVLSAAGEKLLAQIGLGIPSMEQENHKQRMEAAKKALGKERFEALYDQGRSMEIKDAVTYALE